MSAAELQLHGDSGFGGSSSLLDWYRDKAASADKKETSVTLVQAASQGILTDKVFKALEVFVSFSDAMYAPRAGRLFDAAARIVDLEDDFINIVTELSEMQAEGWFDETKMLDDDLQDNVDDESLSWEDVRLWVATSAGTNRLGAENEICGEPYDDIGGFDITDSTLESLDG